MSAAVQTLETSFEAQERARLATEAFEAKEQECARLQDQLTAERTRRGELELQLDVVDRTVTEALAVLARACQETTRAKMLCAQPVRAGSGAGV